jgi:hypothetical protein
MTGYFQPNWQRVKMKHDSFKNAKTKNKREEMQDQLKIELEYYCYCVHCKNKAIQPIGGIKK